MDSSFSSLSLRGLAIFFGRNPILYTLTYKKKPMGNWNHNYYIYLLSNKYNSVIYTGMTNNIQRRIIQHKSLQIAGITSRYRGTKLGYCEHYMIADEATR